ncbi:MAG: O-antigen ligase family protein [Patescibacteria group bacterium]
MNSTRIIAGLVFFVLTIPALPPIFFPLFEPYTFGKMELFEIAVELMALVFAFSVKHRGALVPVLMDRLVIAVGMLCGVAALATLVSVDITQSFWGSSARGDGLFPLLHFALFFFVLRAAFTHNMMLSALRFSVGASLFTAWYGVAQWFALPLVSDPMGEIFSTIGNPAFFAAYLAMHIFCALYLARGETRANWHILWYTIAVFEVVVAVLANSAAVTTGLMLGLLVAAYPYAKERWGGRSITLAAGGSVLCIAGAFLFFANPILDRTTTQSRLFVWKHSIGVIAERPFIGHGAQQFSVPVAHTGETFDKPHNIFLELLVSYGIAGLMAYLFMWYAAERSVHRIFSEQKDRFLFWGLGVSYVMFLFFFFEVFATALLFFFLLALLGAQAQEAVPLRPFTFVPTGGVVVCVFILFAIFHYQPLFTAYFSNRLFTHAAATGTLDNSLKTEALRYDSFNRPFVENAIALFEREKKRGSERGL